MFRCYCSLRVVLLWKFVNRILINVEFVIMTLSQSVALCCVFCVNWLIHNPPVKQKKIFKPTNFRPFLVTWFVCFFNLLTTTWNSGSTFVARFFFSLENGSRHRWTFCGFAALSGIVVIVVVNVIIIVTLLSLFSMFCSVLCCSYCGRLTNQHVDLNIKKFQKIPHLLMFSFVRNVLKLSSI